MIIQVHGKYYNLNEVEYVDPFMGVAVTAANTKIDLYFKSGKMQTIKAHRSELTKFYNAWKAYVDRINVSYEAILQDYHGECRTKKGK